MNNPPPTVDLDFIISMIDESDMVQGKVKVGKSTGYVLKGTKPIAKRTIIINQTGGQVPYEWATGTAMKLKCPEKLSEWFERNRNYKDGGYFKPK